MNPSLQFIMTESGEYPAVLTSHIIADVRYKNVDEMVNFVLRKCFGYPFVVFVSVPIDIPFLRLSMSLLLLLSSEVLLFLLLLLLLQYRPKDVVMTIVNQLDCPMFIVPVNVRSLSLLLLLFWLLFLLLLLVVVFVIVVAVMVVIVVVIALVILIAVVNVVAYTVVIADDIVLFFFCSVLLL